MSWFPPYSPIFGFVGKNCPGISYMLSLIYFREFQVKKYRTPNLLAKYHTVVLILSDQVA